MPERDTDRPSDDDPDGTVERLVVDVQRRVETYNDRLDDDPSPATYVPPLDPLFDWLERRTNALRTRVVEDGGENA